MLKKLKVQALHDMRCYSKVILTSRVTDAEDGDSNDNYSG